MFAKLIPQGLTPMLRLRSVSFTLSHSISLAVAYWVLIAHEKMIVNGDPVATKAAQDAEIDKAEYLLISGYSTCWGVERRTQHD